MNEYSSHNEFFSDNKSFLCQHWTALAPRYMLTLASNIYVHEKVELQMHNHFRFMLSQLEAHLERLAVSASRDNMIGVQSCDHGEMITQGFSRLCHLYEQYSTLSYM